MAFRHDGQVVFQIQLARRQEAFPLTREYMWESERTMAEAPHSCDVGRIVALHP